MAEHHDWSFAVEPDEEPDCRASSAVGFRAPRSCLSGAREVRRLLELRRQRADEAEVLSGEWAVAFWNLFEEDL